MFEITWTVAKSYSIHEGVVISTPGTTLQRQAKAAGRCNWARLAGVHERVQDGYTDGRLSAKAEQVLLDWCHEWGLFGVLQEEFSEVRLPSFYELRETHPDDAEGGEFRVMPVQKIFRRETGRWVQIERNEQASNWWGGTPIYDPAAQVHPPDYDDMEGQPVPDPEWRPVGLRRQLGGDRIEGVSLDDLRVFFPNLGANQSIPEPLTNVFWQHYGESLAAWLRAAKFMLASLKSAQAGAKDTLEFLSSNGRLQWVGAGKKKVEWSSGSAMAAMAFGALLELQEGRVRVCQHCKGPFLAKRSVAAGRKWCSTQCFQTGNKRKQRKRR